VFHEALHYMLWALLACVVFIVIAMILGSIVIRRENRDQEKTLCEIQARYPDLLDGHL
jgi:flagellar biosynthesis/type III secretory pathway M-ring protein FliF/YscJ